MLLFSNRGDTSKKVSPVLACLLASGTVVFTCGPSLASDSVVPFAPQIQWIAGPATVNLDVADLKVPREYKFADAQAARSLLTNGIPKGLAGVLAPESGAWWIVFSWSDVGYVKEAATANLNATAILNGLARDSAATLTWELEPAFDAADNSLGWALRQQTKTGASVTQTMRLLGRRGTLDASVTRPYRGFSDLVPIRQLVRGVSFHEGDRYTDYNAGEKVASGDLASLVSRGGPLLQAQSEPAAAAVAKPSPLADLPWFWIGVSGGAVILCGIVIMIVAVRNKPGERNSTVAPHAAAASSPSGVLSAEPVAAPVASLSTTSRSKAQQPAASLRLKPSAGGKRVNGHRHAAKREFDYNRYFTDLMGAVSSHSSHLDAPVVNGYGQEPAKLPAPGSPENGAPYAEAVLQASSELISHQRSLIEDQKRLIQEQNKLIEEKAKLITQKNQLLKMQADMMDQKLM
ncbi:MAG: hypothetical protein C5B50_22610 [Verrucomicrobia bacterium]|nr:MAG: hypothetical protein C5B50_22610 [Verrucomicrobiota bacterium]